MNVQIQLKKKKKYGNLLIKIKILTISLTHFYALSLTFFNLVFQLNTKTKKEKN